MKEKIEDFLFTAFWILMGVAIIIVTWVLIDFRNDYKCSTTDDVQWYIDNNCMRYEH